MCTCNIICSIGAKFRFVGTQNDISDGSFIRATVAPLRHFLHPTKPSLISSDIRSTIDAARVEQDASLASIGLFRFKIPEDGNCLFRAIAQQLGLPQDYHSTLRKECIKWLYENEQILVSNNLLEENEIREYASDGQWAGFGALTAICNLHSVQIILLAGNDVTQSPQMIKPYESCIVNRTLKVSYLYCGHYDALVKTKDECEDNPVYAAWVGEKERWLSVPKKLLYSEVG